MQEILFGLVLFAILAYGAWRFIGPRLNKGGPSGVGKSKGKQKRR